jgi:hypothetical protein
VTAGSDPTETVPVTDCDTKVTGRAPAAEAENGTNVPALLPPMSEAENGVAVPVLAVVVSDSIARTDPVTQIAEATVVLCDTATMLPTLTVPVTDCEVKVTAAGPEIPTTPVTY